MGNAGTAAATDNQKEDRSIVEERLACVTGDRVWVVKVGSRVLTDQQGRLDRPQIARLAKQLAGLRGLGKQVVLVSSGAVASGVGRLGLPSRPKDLATLQAVAAVGQAALIQAYEEEFSSHGTHAAQVLLTAEDLDDRARYLNVRNTLSRLLELQTVPVINENDTVAVDELKTTFGDNDRLAAMVASLFPESLLVILSDVRGLYDRDPIDPAAQVLPVVPRIDEAVEGLVRDRATGVSKGGMASKLAAARFVTQSGDPACIAWGRQEDVLLRLARGEMEGTVFLPHPKGLSSRKRWIGFSVQCAGTLRLDAGAAHAVRSKGSSLLPVGVVEVIGEFRKGDAVSMVGPDGREVARGLVNYDAQEVRKIAGLQSDRIAERLGHCPYEELVHRDQLTPAP